MNDIEMFSSSSSSDYDDSDDEYKIEKKSTLRKRRASDSDEGTWKKKKLGRNIRQKESRENTEEINDNNEQSQNVFPQNHDSDKETRLLLEGYLSKRNSKKSKKRTSSKSDDLSNLFSDKLAGSRSLQEFGPNRKTIYQSYHPNMIDQNGNNQIPSFIIWKQPFKSLVHQKNVSDVNENVKSIVQKKIQQRLEIRKNNLLSDFMAKYKVNIPCKEKLNRVSDISEITNEAEKVEEHEEVVENDEEYEIEEYDQNYKEEENDDAGSYCTNNFYF